MAGRPANSVDTTNRFRPGSTHLVTLRS